MCTLSPPLGLWTTLFFLSDSLLLRYHSAIQNGNMFIGAVGTRVGVWFNLKESLLTLRFVSSKCVTECLVLAYWSISLSSVSSCRFLNPCSLPTSNGYNSALLTLLFFLFLPLLCTCSSSASLRLVLRKHAFVVARVYISYCIGACVFIY